MEADAEMSDADLAMTTIQFLARNYRVGIAEMRALTQAGMIVLSSTWCHTVIAYAVDVPLRQERAARVEAEKNGEPVSAATPMPA